jgi:hypothetical protein
LVIRQLCGNVATTDEGQATLVNNFAHFPVVSIQATAGHWESREVQEEQIRQTNNNSTYWVHYRTYYSAWGRVDCGGGTLDFIYVPSEHRLLPKRIERRFVIVWTDSWTIPFRTWQENGELPQFPRDKFVVQVNSHYRCLVDRVVRAEMDRVKALGLMQARTYDTDVSAEDVFFVEGFVSSMAVSMNDDMVVPVREFYATGKGIALWFVCTAVGYQAAYECFCNLGYDVTAASDQAAVQCVKVISSESNWRARYENRDEVAAQRIANAIRQIWGQDDRSEYSPP